MTLRDLIDWTSRDAVRFFLISRKADTEFIFDVDLALKRNDENPVFYVQYAHARICSVLEQSRPQGGDVGGAGRRRPVAARRAERDRADAASSPTTRRCWPRAAADLAPHDVAFYLRDARGGLPQLLRRRALPGRRRRRWRARAWPCWRRRARCCATRSPCSASSAPERMDRETGDRMKASPLAPRQRGGFVIGLIVGLLVGLALALGVALYVTKVPVPFVNKVPQRTAEQDAAEAERNRNWDPNAPLAGKNPAPRPAPAAAGVGVPPPPAPRRRRRRRRPRAGRAGASPRAAAGATRRADRRAGGAAARRGAAGAEPRRRSVHLLRAGRRLRPHRRRRAAARQAGDARRRAPGSPSASRPGARSTACASARSTRRKTPKARKDKLGDSRRRRGAGRACRSKVAPSAAMRTRLDAKRSSR